MPAPPKLPTCWSRAVLRVIVCVCVCARARARVRASKREHKEVNKLVLRPHPLETHLLPVRHCLTRQAKKKTGKSTGKWKRTGCSVSDLLPLILNHLSSYDLTVAWQHSHMSRQVQATTRRHLSNFTTI